MNVQYISDSSGKTTGVFIPINEWNELKRKFKGLEQEELEVPDWHAEIVRERKERYRHNPDQTEDFDSSLDDIDNSL